MLKATEWQTGVQDSQSLSADIWRRPIHRPTSALERAGSPHVHTLQDRYGGTGFLSVWVMNSGFPSDWLGGSVQALVNSALSMHYSATAVFTHSTLYFSDVLSHWKLRMSSWLIDGGKMWRVFQALNSGWIWKCLKGLVRWLGWYRHLHVGLKPEFNPWVPPDGRSGPTPDLSSNFSTGATHTHTNK